MQLMDQLYIGVFSIMVFSAALWLSVYFLNREKVNEDPSPNYLPSISFIVPAYNEEEYIEECIDSLLNQDYPSEKLEIIAINDGSTDATLEKLQQYKDRITIIDKENTGKASSMNCALPKVDTELVGCLDADSVADKDLIQSMVGYFEQDGVKGVTTAMKVRNPKTWAQKVMWAEFIYNVFLRKLFSVFDSQWVMPGPGSIYDTEYLKDLGGWDEETVTEDMEIAFRMFKHGAKLKNSTNAYVGTESPPTLKGLLRQRTRWYRGYLDNMVAYKEFWFNPRYGNLGVIILPFNAIFIAVTTFLLTHVMFRAVMAVHDSVASYFLLGTFMTNFNLSIQNLTMFHFFYALLGIGGVGLLWLSLKTAEEKLNLWERKTHYILFLATYSLLYAVFWIAAIVAKIRGVKKW